MLLEDDVGVPDTFQSLVQKVNHESVEGGVDGLRFHRNLEGRKFLGKLLVLTGQNLDEGGLSGTIFSQKNDNF